MNKSLPSMIDIPIGPDGIADRQTVINLLEAQIAQMRQQSAERQTYYEGLRANCEKDYEEKVKLTDMERRDLKRLRSKEMKILERWVRRRAVTTAAIEKHLLIALGASIVIPLFIVLLSLAWKLATWAVLE